jgi:hypothetical protein
MIGPNAVTARTLGGGSATVFPRTWCRRLMVLGSTQRRHTDGARNWRAEQRAHRHRPESLLQLPMGRARREVIFPLPMIMSWAAAAPAAA